MYVSSQPPVLLPLIAHPHIGPTCKKMQDLRPNVVFLSSAFYPSEEEMNAARRAAAAAKRRGPSPPAKKRKIEVLELSDDDSSDSDLDDDILDFKVLMKSTPKDKGKAGCKTPAKSARKDESEEDSEDDDDEPSSKGKGKNKNEDEAASGQPNEHLLSTWKQGGSTVESSAKMLQMIGYLKEWESSGDKIIVFSQCMDPSSAHFTETMC